jgi:AraC-like DNA-binding protein
MTDDSVEDIMIQTGYLGRTNFFAQFRKRFGCSPQDYHQKNRPEQIERAVCSIPGN